VCGRTGLGKHGVKAGPKTVEIPVRERKNRPDEMLSRSLAPGTNLPEIVPFPKSRLAVMWPSVFGKLSP
jgi:hypothetical protein